MNGGVGPRLQIVGRIHNFVMQAGPSAFEQLHKEGLTFVAMDSRAFPYWGGDTLADQWVVRRVAHKKLRELQPWPDTGWRFGDEASARNAYQILRQHVAQRLPGVQMIEDKSPERELADPQTAWAEAFVWNGSEVVFLACDRTNDALATALTTVGLVPFQNAGGPPSRNVSYATHTGGAYVAVGIGPQGSADHVVVVFSPGDETQAIEGGLAGAEPDASVTPFEVDVPSGILCLAWGRVAGPPLFQAAQGHDPAGVVNGFLGNMLARPVPTPLDPRAPGPLAYAIRVTPGVYACSSMFLVSELGVSMMTLSRAGADPLFVRGSLPPPAAMAQQPMAPAQAMAPAQQDPVIFPGQPVGRLSEYVALMRGMQTGDFQGALARAGIDVGTYSRIAQQWGARLSADPGLAALYDRLLLGG